MHTLPPELQFNILLYLSEKDLEYIKTVFAVVNDSYFVGVHQCSNYSLDDCCHLGLEDGVKIWLKQPNIDVNSYSDKSYPVGLGCVLGGLTPLHIAAVFGQASVVEILIADKRVDINLTNIKVHKYDPIGRTALHFAAKHGHNSVVKILIKDPRVDVNQTTKGGWTPFMEAASYGRQSVIRTLLKDQRVDINRRISRVNYTTAAIVAALNGQMDTCDLICRSPRYSDYKYVYQDPFSDQRSAVGDLPRVVALLGYGVSQPPSFATTVRS